MVILICCLQAGPALEATATPHVPKLREGDRQVPEGIYSIESLNPNSLYHLSLRVNYPNDEDRRIAAREGRTNLGSDIMIHGAQPPSAASPSAIPPSKNFSSSRPMLAWKTSASFSLQASRPSGKQVK